MFCQKKKKKILPIHRQQKTINRSINILQQRLNNSKPRREEYKTTTIFTLIFSFFESTFFQS
jgi:hypothetical protein